MADKRILTGDRPTGPLHLGHYFGTLKNRVDLQNDGYDCFIIIADYQVLTDRLDTSNIKHNILELAKDYVSVGLDHSKSTFFVQSNIPELAELTLLFSMMISVARISRNPTVKEEVKRMKLEENFSLGMFSYPASQAADILLFNPNLIPVGEDQLPHIELTKEVARKFNNTYGEVFKVPEALLSEFPRLKGLDGQEKMSKSRGNAIFLSDTPDIISEKVMKAKTDLGKEVKHDPKTKPEISNLLDLYKLTSGKAIDEIEKDFEGKGYGDFKKSLAEQIITFIKPIQEKRSKISDADAADILKEGNRRAKEEAVKSMDKVKKAMKMDYSL